MLKLVKVGKRYHDIKKQKIFKRNARKFKNPTQVILIAKIKPY